jgi:AcrR family transcriptional regulator
MPRNPHSLDRGDLLTDAVMTLLVEHGPTGVSLRRLADARGLSMGALNNRWGTRERMLHIAINYFRARWTSEMSVRVPEQGGLAFLPSRCDEVEDCIVWSGFRALARTDPVLGECVAAQAADERGLLGAALGRSADDRDVLLTQSLVEGLRTALCAPEPMTVLEARDLLSTHLTLLGEEAGARSFSEETTGQGPS